MMISNKLFAGSLVTSLAALSVSVAPQQVQAQAFKLGETGTSPGSAAENFAGQTFRFTVGGDFAGTTSPSAVLNSIKFSLAGTAVPNTDVTAFLFDTTSGLPTAANALAGIGKIGQSTSTTVINPDTEFITGALRSLSFSAFTLSGSSELSTDNEYGIFFSLIDANNDIRRSNEDAYSGGTFYSNTGAAALVPATDSFFIVDATAVPFEFEASGGVAILGGLFLAKKLKNRKQTEKTDEQA